MSDYSSLKATINANVKANNNQEITGTIMNSVLNAMVNSLGAGYQFIGVATQTNPGSAQTPDYKCFYLATTPGTYTNLGGLVVADGEVALLKWDTSWTKEVTGVATADQVSQLGQEIGTDTPETIIYNQDSEILHWYWDGSKYVYNANWGLFLIPLESGRTYNISNSNISGYNNRKFFSALPEVGVEISPSTDPGNEFIGGENIKYLCVNFIWSTYESGSDKDYEILASAYGIKKDISGIKKDISGLQSATKNTNLIQAYPYFAGGNVPSFAYDNGKYIITWPNATLWVVALDGSYVFTVSSVTSSTFTIGLGDRLVYNRTTEIVEVVSSLVGGDYIVLAFNNGGLLEGLFANYFVEHALLSIGTKISARFNRNVEIRDISYIEFSEDYANTVGIKFLAGATIYYGDPSAGVGITLENDTDFTLTGDSTLVIDTTDSTIKVLQEWRKIDTYRYIPLAYCYRGIIQGGWLQNFRLRGLALGDNSVRKLYFYDKHINEAIIQGKYNGGINLLLFSDIHGDGVRLQRLMEFRSNYYYSFHDTIHLGDTVVQQYSDGVAFWDAVANSNKILNVIGNHDTAEIINDNYDWKAISNVNAYTRYMSNIGQWNVNQPSDAATYGRSYYYKDYGSAPNKIRMIVLDCMVMGQDASNYDANQITWFETVLTDAKNNSLPVLLVSHCAPKSVPIDCQFTSNYFDASGQFGGGYGGDDVFVSAVEQFINNGGVFISWLCGDTHKDYLGHIVGHPEQPVIIVGSALCSSTTSITMTRVAGTPTEDLFNILSIHPNRKTIKIKRVGSAIDIDYKSHDILSFNYETREVITSM